MERNGEKVYLTCTTKKGGLFPVECQKTAFSAGESLLHTPRKIVIQWQKIIGGIHFVNGKAAAHKWERPH